MSTATAPTTTIRIPTPLRAYTDDAAAVDVTGSTVGEALQDLVATHPQLKSHLYTDEGTLRSFVNVYRGDEDIRYLDGADTPLSEGDELSIVPSIAGGAAKGRKGERGKDRVRVNSRAGTRTTVAGIPERLGRM